MGPWEQFFVAELERSLADLQWFRERNTSFIVARLPYFPDEIDEASWLEWLWEQD